VAEMPQGISPRKQVHPCPPTSAATAASCVASYVVPLHPPLMRLSCAVLEGTWSEPNYSIEDSKTGSSTQGGIQVLKGKSVLLRPVKRSDISYFLEWFNDPEVIQYIGLYLPMTEMAEEKFIEELGSTRARSDALFVIEVIEGKSTKPVGNCGLHQINAKDHNALFGITIGEKDYWGKGYGTESTQLLIDYGFQQLNLHRIWSYAFAFNERSIRLHKKVGFRDEGRLRQATFKNGQYYDLVQFGMLREEWRGL
jgi:RimJ/RimL family protein N-acetyltransferase